MADDKQKDSGFFSKAIHVLLLPVAALSAWFVAKYSVYNSAYVNAKEQGLLTVPLTDELKAIAPGIVADERGYVPLTGEEGVRTLGMRLIDTEAQEAIKNGKTFDIIEKSKPHHAKMDEMVEGLMKKKGLGSVRGQWKFMRYDQKQKAVMTGMAVAGIAVTGLGTVVNWLENKALAHRMQEHGAGKDTGQER